jgi:hypothetical protein
LQAQLAIEWSTGARVFSGLYGVRLCDVILAKGREQIIFRPTKNGQDVAAVLDPTAVAVLKDLKWRGRLHERETPLFLTIAAAYTDNGRAGGDRPGDTGSVSILTLGILAGLGRFQELGI